MPNTMTSFTQDNNYKNGIRKRIILSTYKKTDMTNQEKIDKLDTLETIRTRIGGCFGSADKLFAGHPNDEKRAKEMVNELADRKTGGNLSTVGDNQLDKVKDLIAKVETYLKGEFVPANPLSEYPKTTSK